VPFEVRLPQFGMGMQESIITRQEGAAHHAIIGKAHLA
jgi:hypothetical protein